MRALLLLLLLAALPALADDDAAALLLADRTAATAEASSDWHVFVETDASEWRPQGAGLAAHGSRFSLDAKFDKTFAPGWRAVFADRLDLNRTDGASGNSDFNTLKEAYLSWQAAPDRIADLGRINARSGVAFGLQPDRLFPRRGAAHGSVARPRELA